MMVLLGGLLAVVLAQAQGDRTVSGAVVDEAGRPVAGARVVLYAPPMWSGKENTAESETATDAEGRFRLSVPPMGRRFISGVSILAYRPGRTIAVASLYPFRERFVVRNPEPRTIRVEGPDGRPIAGARVTPRLLIDFDTNAANVPDSLAATLAVATGADGQAAIRYLAARDRLGAVRVTTDSIGAQDIPLDERLGQGLADPVITIRLTRTSRLSGGIVDRAVRPVVGQEVEIWSRGDDRQLPPSRVEMTGGPLRTAADGSFRTPENLFVGSRYRVVVRAPGKETILSDWIAIGDRPQALLPMRLDALQTVSGRVVDRQGKPVAGVEVYQTGDGPEPTSARSGAEGRFSLGGFRPGRVLLFVRGDGFRMHGQLIRADASEVAVELIRTSERPTRAMHVLPEPIPLEESRAL